MLSCPLTGVEVLSITIYSNVLKDCPPLNVITLYFSLEFIHSKKSGVLDTERGEKLTLDILSGTI